jgi:hypothetical protein
MVSYLLESGETIRLAPVSLSFFSPSMYEARVAINRSERNPLAEMVMKGYCAVTTINPVIGIATRLKVGSFVSFSRVSKWTGNHATMIEKRFILIN